MYAITTITSLLLSNLAILPVWVQPATTFGVHPPVRQHHQQHSTRHHFSFLSGLFEAPQIESADQVKLALQDPKAVLVDVRSPGEITHKVQVKGRAWVNAPGTPFRCPTLSHHAQDLLPNKNTPVILYCDSGKRAQKAKEILEQQGYQQVLNAGGIRDLEYLCN